MTRIGIRTETRYEISYHGQNGEDESAVVMVRQLPKNFLANKVYKVTLVSEILPRFLGINATEEGAMNRIVEHLVDSGNIFPEDYFAVEEVVVGL